jgi:hypothetical protein
MCTRVILTRKKIEPSSVRRARHALYKGARRCGQRPDRHSSHHDRRPHVSRPSRPFYICFHFSSLFYIQGIVS